MDQILGFLGGFSWLLIVAAVIVAALFVFIFVRARYKIADANEALVITGGKGEPRILIGGGAFVPPLRKGEMFNLGLRTVSSRNEETQTSAIVPVVVEWTAQLRADTSLDEEGKLNESLRNAILSYTNFSGDISEPLQQTLEGEVRAVIGNMSPEEIVLNKQRLTENVDKNVLKSMQDLGFKLISFNIGRVYDNNGYYNDLAAKDREARRYEASNLKAEADQSIAVRNAQTNQASKAAEKERDLAVAEQMREVSLRRAEIKAETDVAEADAEIAGQLQKELRGQELAEREGQVAVIREQQAQAAALARREVDVTQAETAKQTKEIQAESDARKAEIDAQAAAEVTRRNAQAAADAATIAAQGKADAISRTTDAEARQIRETGLAEAEVTRAKGTAVADATLAQGKAEAEVQRLNAEALAANDGANLKVRIAEIQSTTQITVSTEVGKAMATIGSNAKFIDMGGSASSGDDLLSRVLGNVPGLFSALNIQSDALHGTDFAGLVSSVVNSVKNGEPIVDAVVVDETKPADTASEAAEAPGSNEETGWAADPQKVQTASEPEAPVLTAAQKVDALFNLELSDEEIQVVAKQFGTDAGVIDEIAQRYGLPKEIVAAHLENIDDVSSVQQLRSFMAASKRGVGRGR